MKNIWLSLKQELAAGHAVMLMYVVHSAGSSPGRQGFKMLVSESGRLSGSIGVV
jgi:xanthine dehydrogenase accessory factor